MVGQIHAADSSFGVANAARWGTEEREVVPHEPLTFSTRWGTEGARGGPPRTQCASPAAPPRVLVWLLGHVSHHAAPPRVLVWLLGLAYHHFDFNGRLDSPRWAVRGVLGTLGLWLLLDRALRRFVVRRTRARCFCFFGGSAWMASKLNPAAIDGLVSVAQDGRAGRPQHQDGNSLYSMHSCRKPTLFDLLVALCGFFESDAVLI